MTDPRNRGVVFDLWNTLAYADVSPNPVVWMAERLGVLSRPDWGDLIERAYMAEPELRPRFRLALLTNTQSFGLNFIRETGLAGLFDVTCYSFECGLLKPDPRIFQWTADRLGLGPERLTMVGDNLEKDVLAAEAAGWRGILIKRSEASLSHSETGDHPLTVRLLSEIVPLLDD